MTWEEVILYGRKQPKYNTLIKESYLNEDLGSNVYSYEQSEEFEEILKIFQQKYTTGFARLVDIGSGNGITAINFSRKGFDTVAVEPDPSDTVGTGAINFLKDHFKLDNIQVICVSGEDTGLQSDYFDLYFARQTMHHANNLDAFVQEAFRILKPGGLFLTVRDHVVYDSKDKEHFLESHPFHKYYGGENAYTIEQYRNAIIKAGFTIIKIFNHFSTPINYHPLKKRDIHKLPEIKEKEHQNYFIKKIGMIGRFRPLYKIYRYYSGFSKEKVLNEQYIPGRLYSFLANKPD